MHHIGPSGILFHLLTNSTAVCDDRIHSVVPAVRPMRSKPGRTESPGVTISTLPTPPSRDE